MTLDAADDITGIILVGGKSRRMGRDKAFLELGNKTLLAGVAEAFQDCFDRVLLVGDDGDRFAGFDLPVVRDIYPGSALGGLYTGLHSAKTKHIFVSSCDLPFPNREIIRYLCAQRAGFDAVVPSLADGYEPLFAVYAKSCLGPIRSLLESGNLCVYDFYPQVEVRYVTPEELAPFDREGRAFLNINTPEQFERVRKEFSL